STLLCFIHFFFQAEDGIRDFHVTGVQTCALPISLPLLGEGEVYVDGFRQPASKVLAKFGWEPIVLQSKEGLALLNGTQFMSAYRSEERRVGKECRSRCAQFRVKNSESGNSCVIVR